MARISLGRSSICLFLASLLASIALGVGSADQLDVWIGTITPKGGLSKGIYHATLETDSGKLTEPQLAAEIDSPGFVTLHPSGNVLYATGNVNGVPSVIAYRVGQQTGRADLTLINSQPIGDGGAAHLSTDRTGKVLMTAQYGGGSTAIYPLAADLSIGRQTQLIKHQGGSKVVAGRQDNPHAHWVGTSPDNRFVFVPDLGMDKVVIILSGHRQGGAGAARVRPMSAGWRATSHEVPHQRQVHLCVERTGVVGYGIFL